MAGVKVSVVMSVHNGGRYLEESVVSILRQGFTDFELLVVDDGSTDGSLELLTRLARQDPRLTLLRQEHRGQTPSLNRAIEMAKGEYLARQDADDVSMPTRFERQVRYLDEHPSIAAVGTAAGVIDHDGKVIGAIPTLQGTRKIKQGLMSVRATLVHGSVMMRKQALEAVGGYREAFRLCQDFDLWLRIAERFDLDNLSDVLFQWRMSVQGVYLTQRATQLQYGGIGLAFAREREVYGRDSYELLQEVKGDLDVFAAQYRMRGLLYSTWGELLFRGLHDPDVAYPHLRRALLNGHIRPRILGLFGASLLGLRWPGKPPWLASVLTPQA